MYIDIILDKVTITRLLREFAPIRIHMTPSEEDRRWVELDEPEEISLVPGRGVRVVTSGRVRFDVAGITLPFSIRRVEAVLEPVVQSEDGHDRLLFNIEIEKSDLKIVPGLVDTAIMNKVNSALTPSATHMIWDFGAALGKQLSLPERLEPLGQLVLQVARGDVHVDEEMLRFRVRLDVEITRKRALHQV